MRPLLSVFLIVAACGGAQRNEGQVTADVAYEDSDAFAGYQHWAFGGREAVPHDLARSPLDAMQVEALLSIAREELEAKGYREGTLDDADIVFFASLGHKSDATIVYPGEAYRTSDSGVEYQRRVQSIEERNREVTLVIDGFEKPEMFHVFHAQSVMAEDHDDTAAAERALRAIIATVPPAREPAAAPVD